MTSAGPYYERTGARSPIEPGSGHRARGSLETVRPRRNGPLDARNFLGVALIGLAPKSQRAIIGGFADDARPGHALRDHSQFPQPADREDPGRDRGGGIAGLSARGASTNVDSAILCCLKCTAKPAEMRVGGERNHGVSWARITFLFQENRRRWYANVEELGVLRNGVWTTPLCFRHRSVFSPRGGRRNRTAVARPLDREDFLRFGDCIVNSVPRANSQFHGLGAKPSRLTGFPSLNAEAGRFTSRYLHWYVNYACRTISCAAATRQPGRHPLFRVARPEEKARSLARRQR